MTSTNTMMMNPMTGTVATILEWLSDFSNMTSEEWGGEKFEDAGLVEVVMNNGEWIEA